jgi:hypothetical protein
VCPVLGLVQAIDHLGLRLDGGERRHLLRHELLRLGHEAGEVVRSLAPAAG